MGEKLFDLAERTFNFAKAVREFAKQYPKTPLNLHDLSQLVDASGSVGANYIEANESLGKKDFQMRIKISRKEAKEAEFWLKLLKIDDKQTEILRAPLEQEARELKLIFSAILQKNQSP